MTRLWDTANGDVPNPFLSTRPSLPLEVSILFIARPTAKSMPSSNCTRREETLQVSAPQSLTRLYVNEIILTEPCTRAPDRRCSRVFTFHLSCLSPIGRDPYLLPLRYRYI